MRIPAGPLDEIASLFLQDQSFSVLGALSFEDRCAIVPEKMHSKNCLAVELFDIRDPDNASPDYTVEVRRKIEINRRRLKRGNIPFRSYATNLIAYEDELLDALDLLKGPRMSSTVILDITCLPKRYFCFFMKRMLHQESFQNVIVTYTVPGPHGYTHESLAEDPMTCDHLPGFAALAPPGGSVLVVSIGFELLNIRSLLEIYIETKSETKFILSFPPGGGAIKREWDTLRRLGIKPNSINRQNLEAIAAWDAEEVYNTLQRWNEANNLVLAPFGAKPHSLAMALFAIKNQRGLYYTQPKSYNPEYSQGSGVTWAYVVKWAGCPCYDRPRKRP
jgi:hypothetical protein